MVNNLFFYHNEVHCIHEFTVSKTDSFFISTCNLFDPRIILFKQDFKGQEQAENWSRIVVMLFGAVGLIYGWMIQEFSQTIYILAAGLALAALVSLFVFLATFTKSESIMVLSHMQLTVPPWSFFRKKPLKWQKARDPDTGESKSKKKK